MADVIMKIINANPVRNNSSVSGANKFGDYQVIQNGVNENQSLTAIESKYTGRFDDIDPTSAH